MPVRAVLFSLITVALWSTLAYLVSRLAAVPPFFLLGVAFLLGFLPSLVRPREIFIDGRTTLFGVAGIFGYHWLLFMAFRWAPPVEANLLNYLWPILIVLLSPLLLPDCRLKPAQVMG